MYPVMLNLAGKTCVVVGGGTAATRKIINLLAAEAQVVVISPEITVALKTLANAGQLTWIKQTWQTGALQAYRPVLVFAATDQPEINQQVADEARAIAALVNSVDSSTDSDFSNMTTIQQPPLTIALHTGSTSPALARHLKTVIAGVIGDEYATLARWLGDLRPQIKQQIASQQERQAFYEAVIRSDTLSLLHQGNTQAAWQQVQNLVQEWT